MVYSCFKAAICVVLIALSILSDGLEDFHLADSGLVTKPIPLATY